MRIWLNLLLWLMLPAALSAQRWDESLYREIEANIQSPSFPDRTYDVRKYGARTQASARQNQKAINKAIEACSKAGGGRVVVPAGTWHTGAIRLLSGVNLVVEKEATLHFDFIPALYPLVRTCWEGLDIMNYSPCIYAYKAHDVAITGEGSIDGGGSKDTWWPWNGATKHGYEEGRTTESQKMAFAGDTTLFKAKDDKGMWLSNRSMLLWMADHQIPVEQRIFGKGCGMRPQLVNFYECERILLEGVTLLNSPFWVVHPVLSKHFTMRRCKVVNNGPNGDGCDPESCENVLIEDCIFHTGDDCIAIKSGRNADGRRRNKASRNIIVRGCTMEDGHGGVVVGSEISGGVQNVFAENCRMDSPNLDRVLRIKTNTCRGGVTDGIYMRNIQVGQCREAVLRINLLYEPNEPSQRGFIPTVRNVYMENVTCQKSRHGILIQALDSTTSVSHVKVCNSSFSGITHEPVVRSGQYEEVVFEGLTLNGKPYAEPAQALISCHGLSEAMALSEMKRTPEAYYLDFTDKEKRPQGKWSYVMGIELEAMMDAYLRYGNEDILSYIRAYNDKMIAKDGSITGYRLEDYNLDNVRTARFVYRMNQLFPLFKTEGTEKAVRTLFSQLEQQPRTQEGVWWHKEIYHDQVWLDGIYMGLPFYTLSCADIKGAKKARRYYDDAVDQIKKTFARTYDPATGLWKHAWDEKHAMFWAHPQTGQSRHTWARAMGWFCMALVEVLDALPANYARRGEVVDMFRQTMKAVVRHQDEKTGVWLDVLDVHDERNYHESTASCMFVYCLLKGSRMGYLDETFRQQGIKGYEGIVREFVRYEQDGTVSLTQCCSVSGLGPEKSPHRDGSFEYYMSEPIRDNDAKGVGPFIWASLEYEALNPSHTSASAWPERRLYDFVVPRDGNFRQAIEAANARKDTTQRYRIFVMSGNYTIPTKGTTMGGDSVMYADPRTYLKAPHTSLIGEDREHTVLTHITPPATWDNGFGAASPLEGIGNGDVLIIEKSGHHTYLQDLTLRNSMADRTGRNICLHDKSDFTIARNIGLWGYQDSYVSNNSHARYYFVGGVIRGRTDYICGKGDVYFDHVTFQQCGKAGYICAPSVPRKYGYVMSSCYVKNESPDVTYYLGRPWGKATPTAIWINTTVDASPITHDKRGYNAWADMGSGGWPARFAEYHTMLTTGEELDLTGRRASYTDKEGGVHANRPILTADEARQYTRQNVLGDWNPEPDASLQKSPETLLEGNVLRWNECPKALLYAVCLDGKVIDFTLHNHYVIPPSRKNGAYTIRVANQMGGMSER